MALKVKDLARSADKLVERAQAASQDYRANASVAGDAWARGAASAAGAYGAAVTAGNIRERFARGVARAGAAKYNRKVSEVGADRFAPGVAAGRPDYMAGSEPYFSTLANVTLTPRQPRGSVANYQRVQAVGQALNAKRMALLGSAGG